MTRTGAVARLRRHAPRPELEIAPGDAARLGVADGDRVRVISARGAFAMAARVSDAVPEGLLAAPMHWSDAFAEDSHVNLATHAALDPISKQPELKHAAVRVERIAAGAPLREGSGLCACREVSCAAVAGAIEDGARSLAAVERATGAGGACGTCRPEIAGLLRRAPPAPERRRLVVVGSGMVGHRFVESLLERGGAERWQILVLGDEPRPAYDRVHLSDLFAGKTPEDLALASARRLRRAAASCCASGVRVLAIDRERRLLRTSAGESVPYDALVLATGSRAVRAADAGHRAARRLRLPHDRGRRRRSARRRPARSAAS